jgi:hypothetical protein
MNGRLGLVLAIATAWAFPSLLIPPGESCCPAYPSGKPVVNADQTVIIVWDQAKKMEHFIRKASFKSEAEDFGFLIPTPSEPLLDESGNEAFPFLLKLTEPETRTVPRPTGTGCGCGAPPRPAAKGAAASAVVVLSEKQVAGFHAVVLQAESANALIGWLKDHGYMFSPEVEAWAKPYITGGWKITALRMVNDQSGKDKKNVAASSLRMSFKTDHPLFPYREPDSKSAAATLGASHRLLRIYFLGEARYAGQLTPTNAWTGHVAWANPLGSENRSKLMDLLRLPQNAGPTDCWLTEFEDEWPYKVAPADLTFLPDSDQSQVVREPIIKYVSSPLPTDVTSFALVAVVVLPSLVHRIRRLQQ